MSALNMSLLRELGVSNLLQCSLISLPSPNRIQRRKNMTSNSFQSIASLSLHPQSQMSRSRALGMIRVLSLATTDL